MKIKADKYLSAKSVNWKNWESKLAPTTCIECSESHGKIYDKRTKEKDVLPGKMIGGDIFRNDDEKLPMGTNRIWRESDFDYEKGYRNHKRVLYSNDGLLFATYDHYQTFYEILP